MSIHLDNFFEAIQRTNGDTQGQHSNTLATVDPAYTGSTSARVTFDGETQISTKYYKIIGAVIPSSRVLMVKAGPTWIIAGSLSGLGGVGVQSAFGLLVRNVMHGGGILEVVSGSTPVVKWKATIFTTGTGRSSSTASNGYFAIDCPIAGTVVTGIGGAASQTITASGIPLPTFCVLYYILPIGAINSSVAANFRICGYSSFFAVPDHWVPIAMCASDGEVRWWNGHRDTGWLPAPAYFSPWVNYAGAGFSTPGFAKINGEVCSRGLVQGGPVGSNIWTFPVGFRPSPFNGGNACLFISMASGALARLDVTTAGILTYSSGPAAPWVSLESVRFPAGG